VGDPLVHAQSSNSSESRAAIHARLFMAKPNLEGLQELLGLDKRLNY
jgi:hypothetical protein